MTKDEALKLALEALKDKTLLTPNEWKAVYGQTITTIKEALAQPAQEPVGEVNRYGRDSHGRQWHGIHWYDANVDVPHGTKLYTTPQQRPWVGLTDEEVMEMMGYEKQYGHIPQYARNFVEAISAKLKEKNA
jgi:hypothetical protein